MSTDAPPAGRPLVAIFAHPDDEAFSCGGALARYARDHRVVLVSATRGEQGEISDPRLATRDTLAEVRERELRVAARVLGVDDVRFLGYRDSGMEGKADDPLALVNADEREVVGRLVAILRELQPAVVITFEPGGGYGHPDHVTISRLTTLAVDAVSDAAVYPDAGPPASPPRLFYSGIPRGLLQEWLADAREMGIDPGPLASLDLEQVGLPDDAVDAALDVSDLIDRKWAAIHAHRTQANTFAMFERLPDDLRRSLLRREYYHLARGRPLPGPRPASDLFASL